MNFPGLKTRAGLFVPAIFLQFFSLFSASSPAFSDPARTPTWWINQAEKVIARTDNYTAEMHIQELIDGKLSEPEIMSLKFKKPRMIYMKWVKGDRQGTEILFVEGRNKNRIRVRPAGLIGIFAYNIAPDSSLAMKHNRHPIFHTGLEYLMATVADNVRRGIKNGECTVFDRGELVVFGRKAHRIEGILPKDAELAKKKRYYCYRAIVDFDVETKIPLQAELRDWNDQTMELYAYEKVVLNAGLTENDFDPANPAYRLK